MIIEQGKIAAIDASNVWVETVRKSACSSCNARAGCGQAVLGSLMEESHQYKKNLIKIATNSSVYSIGEDVSISIDEKSLIRMSLIAYALPIVLMFLTALISQNLFKSDVLVTLFSLLGLAFGFVLSRYWVSKWDCDSRYHPKLYDPN